MMTGSRFQEYLQSRRPTLVDVALAIAAQGYAVFPCDGQKRPLTASGYKDASKDPAVIRRLFEAAPTAQMIGVPTGVGSGLVVIDVDVKDSRQGMDWLNANAHRMPQTRTHRTGSGGLHILLRHPGGEVRIKNSASKIAPGVDLRADGGYVIWAGSPSYSVADDAPISDIPEWLMPALLPPPEPVAPPVRRVAPALTSDGGTPYGLAALEEECRAMQFASDGTKHAAINKAAYSIGGLCMAGELDRNMAFDALRQALLSIRHRCKDFRAAERTLQRAFSEGTQAPRSAPEPAPPPPIHEAAAFLAKLYAKDTKQSAQALPVTSGLMDLSGVLKLFVDECVRTAIRPQPFLALGAAICVVGTLAGRRYRTGTDLRTNIYVAAIAESGGGKDHAPEIARRAIEAAGLGHYLGGETLASGRAVLTAMEAHPSKLFQIDEFGLFLASVTGPRAPAHKAEVWSELMKLYSRAKGTYRGTEYANRKENPRVDIVQPCCTFYGTSTPSTFWAALAGGAMSDGSLARFLLFISDNNRPDRNLAAGIFEPSDELVSGLRAIAAGFGGAVLQGGNLPEPHTAPMSSTHTPDPYTVPMTEEAEAAHLRGLEAEDAWARKVEGTPQAAIVNRLGENAAKLALISAISRNPSAPAISGRDMEWAWHLAEHCTRSLLQDATRYIANTDYERRVNKALDIIRRHGPISDSQMFDRHNWRLPERDRAEILRSLVAAGMVVAIEPDLTKPGRRTVRYALATGILPHGELDCPND